MNDFVLRLKKTEIIIPQQIKAESKGFPKAKIRTSTPKNRKSFNQSFTKTRPQTPKPSLSSIKGQMMRTGKISCERVRNNSIFRKDLKGKEGRLLWVRKELGEIKRVRVKIRSPARVLVIPSSSMKMNYEDEEF